jgi:ADP-ribose pyrophosphatase
MPKKKTTDREVLGTGKFLRLVRDGRWEIAERTNCQGAVAITAITDDRRLILTEQFRPAVKTAVIDVAAGLSGDGPDQRGEALLVSAQRELLEETGYQSKHWKHLDDCPSSPGLTNEVVTHFLATGCRQTQSGGGVDHEQIIVHAVPLRTIRRWLKARAAEGKLIDPKVYAALYFAKTM